jgi:hypothetical protein
MLIEFYWRHSENNFNAAAEHDLGLARFRSSESCETNELYDFHFGVGNKKRASLAFVMRCGSNDSAPKLARRSLERRPFHSEFHHRVE